MFRIPSAIRLRGAALGALAVLALGLCHAAPALAGITMSEVAEVPLASGALGTAIGQEGQYLYILEAGKLTIYSLADNKVVGTLAVDKEFTSISAAPAGPTVVLSSSKSKKVRIVNVTQVYTFNDKGNGFYGPEKAPVQLTVFTDYQCPNCSKLEPLLQQIVAKYPGQVRLLIKNFPLPSHAFARHASAAALAAQEQGKFAAVHEDLFAHTQSLNATVIDEAAQKAGLDMEKFKKALTDPQIQATIDRDLQEGQAANVQGTPTIFINGKPLQARNVQGLYDTIEQELKNAK